MAWDSANLTYDVHDNISALAYQTTTYDTARGEVAAAIKCCTEVCRGSLPREAWICGESGTGLEPNGIEVSDRGRISAAVREAYAASL